MDASWKTKLSTNPHNLQERPALETSLQIDDLSLQLRDFQCSQISILESAVKEHSFSTKYRKYRPSVSAKENPRAWWKYAFRIIQMELHKGNMRWSWSRFSQ
jgi:vacuolar protein sorting-associated protein 13A/C